MNMLKLGDDLFDPMANRVAMVVTDPTPTMGRVRVLEAGVDTERWIPYDEIRARISAGELELRGKGYCTPAVFMDRNDQTTCKRKVGRQQIPGAQEDAYLSSVGRATRIVRMLKEYCSRYKISAYQAYPDVRKRFEAECNTWEFPSIATVYRLLERDRHNGPLVMPNHLKGNRTERHSHEVVELICKLAEATFMRESSQWTFRELADLCRRTAIRNGLLGANDPLSKKFVRKVIVTKLHSMPEVARMHAKDRPAKASISSYRIRVEGILQRVEQDAVHLPFVIETPDGPCTDVWLIHAIDCGSSNVVGWYLKIGAPTESAGLRCTESSVFSKESTFKYFGIEDCPDIYGVPAMLVLDNGGEAKGARFRRLGTLGIDVHYLKSRHPHRKPFVERLNLSLKRALQPLPGCTRVDDKDGARDPVALGDELMSLEALEHWIVRWYFDKWADSVLERFVDEEVFENRALGITPRERYKNIVSRLGCPLPLPPNQSRWLSIQYNVVVRKLSMKSGVTLDGYEFRGDNLQRLIERFGEERVEVLQDPEDFRRVYVIDGDERVELTNASVGDCTPAFSFSQANERKKSRMSREVETPRSAAFTNAVHAGATQASRSAGKPNKSPDRVQKKAVVEKTRVREAVKRAEANPLLASKTKDGATPYVSIGLDDVDELSPRDRRTGAQV